MTGQLLFMAAMGVVLGVCGGYPWGRVLRRRDAHAEYWGGYNEGFDEGRYGVVPSDDVLRAGANEGEWLTTGSPFPRGDALVSGPEHPGGGLASLAAGSLPGHDWREQVTAELAPEALALANVPEPGPLSPLRSGNGGPGETPDGPGLGHPSPYSGPLTPAQRRRDKHKQRGQYAPQPGWTLEEANILSPHWKPEGDRWVAEWRIEWQDDVAAVDEEIAEWVLRQRAWLAADRWDRGARRLGAVA